MPAAEQTSADARRKAAREVIDILHEIATLLVSKTHPSPKRPLSDHSPRTRILIANNSLTAYR